MCSITGKKGGWRVLNSDCTVMILTLYLYREDLPKEHKDKPLDEIKSVHFVSYAHLLNSYKEIVFKDTDGTIKILKQKSA